MTLIIDFPAQHEAALKAKAQGQGISAEQYAVRVLETDLMNADLPVAAEMSAHERAREFAEWARSHRHTPPLPDDAVSRATMYPDRG